MDTLLTKDARGFVDGVMTYLRSDSKSKTAIPKVQSFLGKITQSARKEKIAKVESTVALSESEKTGMEKALARILGHEVQLDSVVRPDTLAGFRIQVGDWILDMTMKNQLEQMATLLTK